MNNPKHQHVKNVLSQFAAAYWYIWKVLSRYTELKHLFSVVVVVLFVEECGGGGCDSWGFDADACGANYFTK